MNEPLRLEEEIELDDWLVKFLFAEKFGWTPKQVEELSFDELNVFLAMVSGFEKRKEFNLRSGKNG